MALFKLSLQLSHAIHHLSCFHWSVAVLHHVQWDIMVLCSKCVNSLQGVWCSGPQRRRTGSKYLLQSSSSSSPFEKPDFTFLQLMCHTVSQMIYLWAVFFLFAQQCFLKSAVQEKRIMRGYFRLGFKVHKTHPSLWCLLFIEWKCLTSAQTIQSNQPSSVGHYSIQSHAFLTKLQIIQSTHNNRPIKTAECYST